MSRRPSQENNEEGSFSDYQWPWHGKWLDRQLTGKLPRTSEDVAFDMDEVIIEEDSEDYYKDGTSDSNNKSDASSEDSIEKFEL